MYTYVFVYMYMTLRYITLRYAALRAPCRCSTHTHACGVDYGVANGARVIRCLFWDVMPICPTRVVSFGGSTRGDSCFKEVKLPRTKWSPRVSRSGEFPLRECLLHETSAAR